MKLNNSFLACSWQKFMEVDNEYKHCTFYDKCMAKDVAADALAEEWTGYVV
ncbi:40S ribosomal protein S6 [Cricetulus griseus]|uniref:Small ribosomal subunit protein eS6 n=1 Tax=Cricetulus griseus TaxID=10029 RepID=G3HWA9_CRIGR|nr:40S ribosomal protein S6 [Cricetulus griseus]